ncbi:MAG TPA: hypothetical protein VFR34_11395, partial [Paracoccaceae bacterium]|nr:hypothetical protein [Paracoccaceae bacterium]
GIDQITSTVSHLDEMTQKNANLAADSAVQARAAMARAERLMELIGYFRPGSRGGGADALCAPHPKAARPRRREAG